MMKKRIHFTALLIATLVAISCNKEDALPANPEIEKVEVALLSEARENLVGAAAGNKILFAGGNTGCLACARPDYSKAVDIYDVATNTFTKAQLSVARGAFAGAGTANKVLFGGGRNEGGYLKSVDI